MNETFWKGFFMGIKWRVTHICTSQAVCLVAILYNQREKKSFKKTPLFFKLHIELLRKLNFQKDSKSKTHFVLFYFNLEQNVVWNFMQKRILGEGNVRNAVNTAITTTWNCLENFPWRILSKLVHSRNSLVLLKWHFQAEI